MFKFLIPGINLFSCDYHFFIIISPYPAVGEFSAPMIPILIRFYVLSDSDDTCDANVGAEERATGDSAAPVARVFINNLFDFILLNYF